MAVTLMPKLHEAFHQSRSNFSTIISSLKPDLLIYDCFQPWAASIAASLAIPAVHYSVTSAALYSFLYHLYTVKSSPFPYDAIYLHDYEERAFKRTLAAKMIEDDNQKQSFAHFKQSHQIVLIKTSRILEAKYIDYLSLLSNKNLIPTGSLVASSPSTTNEGYQSKMIRQWLNTKKQLSTVLISFGSENYITNDQIQEIAKGLEVCDVNFIWVLRYPKGEGERKEAGLPEGFMERVGERGMIVEWAPQAMILGHPSTGAFVSHCGWNSTLESILSCVPVIGMPLKLDQPYNARLMVEVGVAVEVERDEDGNFQGEAFAEMVDEVVGGIKGKKMRIRAKELSEKMKKEEVTLVGETAKLLRRICVESKLRN